VVEEGNWAAEGGDFVEDKCQRIDKKENQRSEECAIVVSLSSSCKEKECCVDLGEETGKEFLEALVGQA